MMIKLLSSTRRPAALPTWPLVLPLFLATTVLAAACSNGPDARSRASAPHSPDSPGRPTEPSFPAAPSAGTSTPQPAAGEVRIKITIGDTVITARLAENATALYLTAQLPLTLTFKDFNQVEKIAKLPRRLSLEGAPAGDDPDIRDIGYYAPSGDLVFYYGDVGYWKGVSASDDSTPRWNSSNSKTITSRSPSNAPHRPCGERGGAVTHRNPGD
jgi:hypothetical protein